MPLGALLALLLQRTNIWGRSFAWLALGSQMALPLYVFAGGWSAGFGMQGWFTPASGWALQSGWVSLLAVAAIHMLAAIPWVCLIVSLGLVWTHRGQEDVALVEGGEWNLLRCVILPRLRIWIAASCLWCVVPILTEMVVTNLYQVPTVAEQIYLDASRASISPWSYIAGVLFCVLPIAVVGLSICHFSPPWREVVSGVLHFRGTVCELGKMRLWLSALVWGMLLFLVGLPIVNLLIKAGWQPWVDPSGVTRYGWDPHRLFTTARESVWLFRDEYYWSAILAVGSASVALGLSGFLAVLAGRKWVRATANWTALLMIAMPGPLVGMITIFLMNRSSPAWLGTLYDTTLAAPIFAQQFRLWPLAWLITTTILASISPKLWEQAAVDGLSGSQLFLLVLWPQTASRWLSAGLMLVVLSVGELSCSILVLPPGVSTVSMRLFEMLHFGMRHQDSGLCCVLICLGWIVSLASWKTLNER